MQFVPTAHQKADILTTGLTAYAHELARQGRRLQICNGLVKMHGITRLLQTVYLPHIMFQTFIVI